MTPRANMPQDKLPQDKLREFFRELSATRSAVLIGVVVLGLGAWIARTNTLTGVEFYNGSLNQYFIATAPEEADTLDALDGWERTGGQFTAYTYPWIGRTSVCRLIATQGRSKARSVTTDADECARLSGDPAWAVDKVKFYAAGPTAGTCPAGTQPVWRSRVTDSSGNVNDRLVADLTAYSRMAGPGIMPAGVALCAPISEADKNADIVRFLEQSTLGPTEALVEEVKGKGIAEWTDEQLSLNVTRYTQYPYAERIQNSSFASLCNDDSTPPVSPQKYCHTYKIAPSPVGWEFFRQSKTAPDQLRLRMAHVWHQIFVVSDGNGTYAYADFHQRLRDNVFGTFENLLLTFALSPQLGEYQSWLKNVPLHDGIRPNENFARELMQLFTIGVNELDEDGAVRLDADGKSIPTYVQSDIETLARVLTGFDFSPMPGASRGWAAPNYYIGDMIAYEEHHDRGAKRLLDGRIDLPPGLGAMADVRAAIHALVMHPNTSVFISRQLIQKLVTSSPTPGYVTRVAKVFKDNGEGVYGDLAAVTRAVLLDPEARGPRKIDPEYGRLREPVLFWTAMIRALDVTTDGMTPYVLSGESGQLLFLAPSVFNYYPADYTLIGTEVPAPEFGIYNTGEFLTRANHVNDLLYNVDKPPAEVASLWAPQPFVRNALGTRSPSLATLLPDAGNVNELIDRLDKLFLHGTMRPGMRKTIAQAVSSVPPHEALRRVKLAVQLTLTSVDYQVQK
ncbi:MAG: DUF1800 family protein [Casimicrobiaceae bacterium]